MNKSHVVVERVFGALMGRWRCLLKALEENSPKVPLTITACCILLNICILQDNQLDEEFNEENESEDEDDEASEPRMADDRQGREIRQALTTHLIE